MLIVPILWSLWISSPKTFSRAITSPAATWECVEVLMDTEFSVDEMRKLVKKTWSCLAWWKYLKFAPANDEIIKVSYPLYMEAYAKLTVSIMAKIYAWWTKFCLIDLPVGEYGKIKDMKTARRMKWHFEYIWNHLWMKIKVDITNADNPVWKWIWSVLQVREVLRILQNKEKISLDLKNKAIELSANLIELVWLAKWKKAKLLAENQLNSGAAWKYMQKIIKAQNDVHNVKVDKKNISYLWALDSEKLPLWECIETIVSKKSGVIKLIDVRLLKSVARKLWAPLDKQAGFYLNKQVGDKVKKWEVLFEIYSADKDRLNQGIERLDKNQLYRV
jgi:thymidine phosphorylase